MIFGKRIADEFNITMLVIPEEYQAKDPSDFCKKYGRQELRASFFGDYPKAKPIYFCDNAYES